MYKTSVVPVNVNQCPKHLKSIKKGWFQNLSNSIISEWGHFINSPIVRRGLWLNSQISNWKKTPKTQIVQLSWSIGRERVTQSLAAPFGWRLTWIADWQWSLWQGQVSQEGPMCRSDQYLSNLYVSQTRRSYPCAYPSLLSVAACAHWPVANNKTVSKWVSHALHMPRHTSVSLPMAPSIFQLIWVCFDI